MYLLNFLLTIVLELHVPGVCSLVIGCQAAKAEKLSAHWKALAAALQGEEVSKKLKYQKSVTNASYIWECRE